MTIPCDEDGTFDGGLLFDGCGYREPSGIVAYSHAPGRLGLVRDKVNYFMAEFLSKHSAPQFSHAVWDAIRHPVICGSLNEAKTLTDRYVTEGDNMA